MGGGTVAEKIYGTEEGRRKNRIMDSHLTHWGEQTGKAKDGFDHGMHQIADTIGRSDLNISNWGRRDDQKQEAQTASANYTGQSQTQRSGSGKRGSGKLTSTDKKKGKGKRSLTIQK